jgi:hypothetical protein
MSTDRSDLVGPCHVDGSFEAPLQFIVRDHTEFVGLAHDLKELTQSERRIASPSVANQLEDTVDPAGITEVVIDSHAGDLPTEEVGGRWQSVRQ